MYVAEPTRYDGREYRRVGRSGLKLPPISLGLWQNFGGADVFETGRAVVRRAFDRGVTHFDLANNYGPPYGSAEENFGLILAKDFKSYRDQMIISSKAGWDMWPGPYGDGGSRKYLIASLDQSLKRMGLDYVDIFYSHRPTPDAPLEETMGALAHLVFRARRSMSASPPMAPSARATRRASSRVRARRCSSTNRPIRCSIAGSKMGCSTRSASSGSAASPSRRSPKGC